MNKATYSLIALLLAAPLHAGLPYHRDINVTSVNTQTQRTEIVFHPTAEEALSLPLEKSVFYKDLNGVWDYAYYPSQMMLPERLEDCAWHKLNVPGNWEVQGYGTPVYVNTSYEFSDEPQVPLIPEEIPVGVYRRSFSIPEGWAGRNVYLNLCGAKAGVYVYVNGSFASYSEDSKSLARTDITPYLKEGENDLIIKIFRWTSGSYLECQDFWRISGIERDVYLSAEKAPSGFDFEVVSTLDGACRDGIFRFESSTPAHFRLIDKDGSAVAEGDSGFEGRIPSVRKWSAETPDLYTLLLDVEGEYARFDVGFRRTEIKGNVFYFNGQPIKFKGVNLHEHNEFTGHYTDREYIRRNLVLMKAFNINAIRTCHYPQPRCFYELCDSLGFYVYDEANVESHGMGYKPGRTLAGKPEWYAKHRDRTLNMYMSTRNYPCVTLLSLGNEAGNGVNFERNYDLLKDLEAGKMNRPVVYERARKDRNSDFANPMYPTTESLLEEAHHSSGKPFAACEYSHAMGNSNGSFDLMWKVMYAYDNLQGGFIWDWIDQGLAAKGPGGRPYWTYGGDYGDPATDPEHWFRDRNFNCNGVVGPDLQPHPGLMEVKYWYSDLAVESDDPMSGVYKVFNRRYFRSLEGVRLHWVLKADGLSVKEGDIALSAAPQTWETVNIDIPELDPEKTWHLDFHAMEGHELAWEQFLLAQGHKPETVPEGCKIIVKEKPAKHLIILKGKRSKLVFDTSSGRVVAFKNRGRSVFKRGFGLAPEFWRAPLDNDWGCKFPVEAEAWKDAVSAVEATASCGSDNASIHAVYSLPAGCSMVVDYTLQCDGSLHVGASFKGSAEGETLPVPRIGFRTRLRRNCDALRYYGRGPWENYCDRNSAALVGLYESSAAGEYVPYVRPQECGHHTDCEWLELGRVRVEADSVIEFNALRCSIEDLDPHNADGSRIWGHVNDIVKRNYVELCIDGAMTGVGGYNSWGRWPEPSRTVWSNCDFSFGFTVSTVAGK